jgi:hypothetical protein
MLQAAMATAAVIDKSAADTTAASQPVDLAAMLPSTSFTIRITPSPVTLSAQVQQALVQGGQLQIPLTVNRMYGFADAVTVEVLVPPSAAGLRGANLTIAAADSAANLIFEAAADAAPGSHMVVLRHTAPFNGQNLQAEYTLTINVEPAQAANP